nr:hypothetical protein [Tanacetum cinerariifolium]
MKDLKLVSGIKMRKYLEKGLRRIFGTCRGQRSEVGDELGQPHVIQEETYDNTSLKNIKLIDAEHEAIHMILNGIGDDIYSIVDAYSTTREMNKKTVTVAVNRETVGNQVQSDDDYNVFAIERQHSEQPESIIDTYVVEIDDSSVIFDSSDMCDNEKKAYQNAEEPEDEHVLLASLITNLKLDVDENKNSH